MARKPTSLRDLRPCRPSRDHPVAAAPSPPSLARRPVTRVACNVCRERRIRCDGLKPCCTACVRQGNQCAYRATPATAIDTLRDELGMLRGCYSALDSLVTTLRVAPQASALESLRQLRAWPSAVDPHPDQPLQQPSVQSLETPIFPQDLGPPGEGAHRAALAEADQGDHRDQLHHTLDLGLASSSGSNPEPLLEGSDPRLEGLDISFWTQVPVTDAFATGAISFYLRTDHRVWELFNADTFLSDLVNHKSDFCSAFLVNCLLAFASQTYEPGGNGIQFEEAARALWAAEAVHSDSETALTGWILLHLCCTARLETNNSDDCIRVVFAMAIRMRLFGVDQRFSDHDMSLLTADRRSSMAHAAWGAFNTMR